MKKQSIRFLALLLAMLMVLSGCTTAPAEQTTKGNVCQSETVVTTDPPENDTPAASAGDETVSAEPTESQGATESTKESVPYGENLEGTLRVVADEKNGMLPQLDRIISKFELLHPNVTVEVEYLPYDDTDAREIALDQLRTAIMAGKGPDI